jgi:heme exporter protein C
MLGPVSVLLVAVTVVMGLWVTPPDKDQGELVRLVYIHPAMAWVALYVAFGMAALCSVLYLWPRTRSMKFDRLAAAAVEVGVVFNILTLITGSIWGKPTWGVWWTWDARLTSTALLLVLFLGYLALRRVPAEAHVRARRCAIAAIVAVVDVPIVHFSVIWWQTLHQGATVLNPNLTPTIHGSMAWTLLLSFIAFTMLFAWMVVTRFTIEQLRESGGDAALAEALVARREEGAVR